MAESTGMHPGPTNTGDRLDPVVSTGRARLHRANIGAVVRASRDRPNARRWDLAHRCALAFDSSHARVVSVHGRFAALVLHSARRDAQEALCEMDRGSRRSEIYDREAQILLRLGIQGIPGILSTV